MVFTPNFPQTCQQKQEVKWWELLEKVEQCARWPQQACTTMFFLIPKNVTNERPIALLLALIRWWEGLRAPEVTMVAKASCSMGRHRRAKWRSGAHCVLEMDRFECRRNKTQRVITCA